MTVTPAAYCAQCHHRCDPDRRQDQELSPCCGARLIDRRNALIHYLARRLNRHFVHRESPTFTTAALASLRAARRKS